MFDKNTLRTRDREMFSEAVEEYRDKRCAPDPGLPATSPAADAALAEQTIAVYLRKRPIFDKEIQLRGDYDVTSAPPGCPATKFVLHNALFQVYDYYDY